MGRGRILSGGDDGLYQVELDTGAAKLAARIQQYQLMIDALAPVIEAYEQRAAQARSQLSQARAEVDARIQVYEQLMRDPQATEQAREQARKAVSQATQNAMQRQATLQASETLVSAKKLERAGLESQRAQLAAVPGTKTVSAWCATLTEDAEGTVATIEVPGEPAEVLVAPQGRAPGFGDGVLLRREAMNGPQAFYNAAILPGWQKFKPTYRFGVASNIDVTANTMTVTLDPARSSAQSLDVNARSTLTDVPVEYLECNAGAFEDGDEVVVMFPMRSWESPRVVGFRREPKPCGWSAWYGAADGAVHYLYPFSRAAKYFDAPIGEYVAEWRLGGGWRAMDVIRDEPERRHWIDLSTPADGSVLQPSIEIWSGILGNAWLANRPLVLRDSGGGEVFYTATGVNEFRMRRGDKTLFHYAFQQTGSGSGPPSTRLKPWLVGGLRIIEPAFDLEPFASGRVDGYIPGWTPT